MSKVRFIQLGIGLISFMSSVSAWAWGFCPYCGGYGQMSVMPMGGMYAMPSFFPSSYPWYAPYGAMAYPQSFFGPGPWAGPGMMPGMYPGGGGHGMMGKPNVYISGPDGTDVKVQVKFPSDSNLLAAVPIHGEQGWKGTLKSDHQIQSSGAVYPYFFYDFRFNETKLQDQFGFCLSKKDLVPRLAAILKELEFLDSEIKDFEEYWSLKMPDSESYCVYPQGNREMDQIATLSIDPAPKSVRRIGFMIMVKEGIKNRLQKFSRAPRKEWIAQKPEERKPSQISVGIEVREWGVGFLELKK